MLPQSPPSPPPPTSLPLSPDAECARLIDPTRLAALRATGLLGGVGNEVLDRLARLATRLLGTPVALVSLVDGEGQHFAGKAAIGGWAGEQRRTPLTYSFCQHVVARDAMLLVSDAANDPLVASNLAFRELGVVAYCGVPLRTSDGQTLGSFCAIDAKPVAWTAEQIATLEDLASAAAAEIELRATVHALEAAQERLRSQAVRDDLTGLLNRRGFAEESRRVAGVADRTRTPFLVVAMDLDGFKEINDTLGHSAGDEALVEMAAILTTTFRSSDVVARMGGDEFVLLLPNTPHADIPVVRARIDAALAEHNRTTGKGMRLASSVGFAAWDATHPAPLAMLLREADEAMYAAKKEARGQGSAVAA